MLPKRQYRVKYKLETSSGKDLKKDMPKDWNISLTCPNVALLNIYEYLILIKTLYNRLHI
jgi:hypothetical protein